MNFKKLAVLTVGAVFAAQAAFASTGWLESFVFMNDGNGDTFYNLNADGVSTGLDDFDGANLGTFDNTAGDVLWLNSEINAWADGGDEFTEMTLYWRLGQSGAFTAQTTTDMLDQGGNNWRGITPGVDLVATAGLGTHTIEVFASRTHTWDGGEGGPLEIYMDTTTTAFDTDAITDTPTDNFFTASFEVIPEPGTMGLLAIGLMGVAALRRRLS